MTGGRKVSADDLEVGQVWGAPVARGRKRTVKVRTIKAIIRPDEKWYARVTVLHDDGTEEEMYRASLLNWINRNRALEMPC